VTSVGRATLARMLGLGLAAVALAGCGVATEASPRAIPRQQVPFRLLSPTASTPTTVPAASNVTVYFVNPSQQLTPVLRAVTPPGRLSPIMQALVAGPTSSEQINNDLSSAITPNVQVLGTTEQADGVAVVNFNSAFIQIGSSSQVMAVAQVVYTATEQPGVQSVQIDIDGKPTDVPTASNAEVSRPVTRADYGPEAPTTSQPVG
jgi:spore germination protein GerM